jgi:hypothetical protein
MSDRNSIYAALNAGANDSPTELIDIFPDEAPQQAVYPLVVFLNVGGHDDWHLEGSSGLRRRVVQVDVWASDPDVADALMERMIFRMKTGSGFSLTGIAVAGAPPYEPDTKLYRVSREFILWFQS